MERRVGQARRPSEEVGVRLAQGRELGGGKRRVHTPLPTFTGEGNIKGLLVSRRPSAIAGRSTNR